MSVTENIFKKSAEGNLSYTSISRGYVGDIDLNTNTSVSIPCRQYCRRSQTIYQRHSSAVVQGIECILAESWIGTETDRKMISLRLSEKSCLLHMLQPRWRDYFVWSLNAHDIVSKIIPNVPIWWKYLDLRGIMVNKGRIQREIRKFMMISSK